MQLPSQTNKAELKFAQVNSKPHARPAHEHPSDVAELFSRDRGNVVSPVYMTWQNIANIPTKFQAIRTASRCPSIGGRVDY